MKLFEKLGAKNEAEAFEIVDRVTAFTTSIVNITGEEDTDAAIGKIAAWKQASMSDEKRKEEEGAAASSILASMASAGIGNAEKLKATYENDGFAALVTAADGAKKEHTEAQSLIGELVTSGRLAPKARGAFEELFASTGLKALKAAAAALPDKPRVVPGPAPEAEGDDGLTASERARADSMKDPATRERYIAARKERHAKKGN